MLRTIFYADALRITDQQIELVIRPFNHRRHDQPQIDYGMSASISAVDVITGAADSKITHLEKIGPGRDVSVSKL